MRARRPIAWWRPQLGLNLALGCEAFFLEPKTADGLSNQLVVGVVLVLGFLCRLTGSRGGLSANVCKYIGCLPADRRSGPFLS